MRHVAAGLLQAGGQPAQDLRQLLRRLDDGRVVEPLARLEQRAGGHRVAAGFLDAAAPAPGRGSVGRHQDDLGPLAPGGQQAGLGVGDAGTRRGEHHHGPPAHEVRLGGGEGRTALVPAMQQVEVLGQRRPDQRLGAAANAVGLRRPEGAEGLGEAFRHRHRRQLRVQGAGVLEAVAGLRGCAEVLADFGRLEEVVADPPDAGRRHVSALRAVSAMIEWPSADGLKNGSTNSVPCWTTGSRPTMSGL